MNSFARMESDCVLKHGLIFFMKNIYLILVLLSLFLHTYFTLLHTYFTLYHAYFTLYGLYRFIALQASLQRLHTTKNHGFVMSNHE